MDDEARSTRQLWVALAGAAPIAVAGALVGLRDEMLNANVALVLVLVVVGTAVGGGRAAGAVAAISAALSFNFFHTRPYLTLEIDSRNDVETTVLLLLVGIAVGQLATWHRRPTGHRWDADDGVRRLHRVAALGARERHAAEDMIMVAQNELTGLLTLASCKFEAYPFARRLPRLDRSGVVSVMEFHGDDGFAFPNGGAELPVLARGNVLGRFVLVPMPNTTASLEQRVLAVAIADQVGPALAAPGTLDPNNPEALNEQSTLNQQGKGRSDG